MAVYHVEGTSTIGRSLLVNGRSDSEASEEALQTARCLTELEWKHVRNALHEVSGARRLIQTATQDQPDRDWAVRMGGK